MSNRGRACGLVVTLAMASSGGVAAAAPGDLDTSFAGGAGFVTRDLGARDFAHGVAIQPDGKIVVAGQTGGLTTSSMFVMRLNPDGQPDPAFGNTGLTEPVFSFQDTAAAVALQPDGRIVTAGTTTVHGSADF